MCTKAVSVNVRALSKQIQLVGGISSVEQQKSDTRPTDLAPVITHHRPREVQRMRWGLIPANTIDLKSLPNMYNAKAETITQLRSFRGLVMTSRCLIPNACFYEYETQGDEKVLWQVNPVNDVAFFKAGLWTTWRNPETQELVNSFTMITCEPEGAKFAEIHDRMPVILTPQERRLWMHPQATLAQLMGLLKPCNDDMYTITEHSRKPLKAAKAPKVKNQRPDNNTLF